jgi:hypothetical protein
VPTSFGSLQSEAPVLVVNLDSINRDLKALGPAISKAAKAGMLQGAEPIRLDAERLAESDISGMKRAKKKPPPWSIQRDGETIHEVYIAPRERGVKSKTDRSRRRPNFVGVMFDKSYDPAFERGRPGVVQFVDNWLGRVSDAFNSSTGTGRI